MKEEFILDEFSPEELEVIHLSVIEDAEVLKTSLSTIADSELPDFLDNFEFMLTVLEKYAPKPTQDMARYLKLDRVIMKVYFLRYNNHSVTDKCKRIQQFLVTNNMI